MPTVQELFPPYLAHYLARTTDRKTMPLRLRVLERHFGGMDVAAIDPAVIEDYMTQSLEEGKAPATVNRRRAALSSFLGWCIKRGHRPHPNPVSDTRKLKEDAGRTRYLTPREAERLVLAAAPHVKPIILFALYSGARLNEILSLRTSDVDLNAKVITLRGENTKSSKTRQVPLHPTLEAALRQVRMGGPEDLLFVFNGRRMRSIRSAFEGACRKAKLGDDVVFHSLRHTFASWATMNGLDLRRLQKFLGHSSISQTERYSHMAPDFLAAGLQFIGPRSADAEKGGR